MALYTNLPVYEDTYQLFLHFTRLSQGFQRDFRYTLGEQVKRALMDMMVDVFRANKTECKVADIAHAREKLVEVQIMIRVLHETRQMSVKQFAMLVEQTASISKQLAIWEKSTKKREQTDGKEASQATV